jgi:2-keto-3-deoxy-6-phosphogluconate aldolase
VAVGSNLIDKQAVAAGNWPVLRDTAQRYVEAVRAARQGGP